MAPKGEAYLDNAPLTSVLRSGGRMKPERLPSRLSLHLGSTVSLMNENIPLALQRKVIAWLSFSSFDFLSTSDMARSCSYGPSDATIDLAKFDKENAWVNNV